MMPPSSLLNSIRSALFGVAIGDSLGVPHEFKSREVLRHSPVTGMDGYGTHNQPAGTWSDDSSLTFCLAEALTNPKSDLDTICRFFVRWLKDGFWSARGEVFDIGHTTREAIERLSRGVPPQVSGSHSESNNGNGSLMRILPLVFVTHDSPITERFELTRQVSAITHGHIRSVIACFYYLEFARLLLDGMEKFEAYAMLQKTVREFLTSIKIHQTAIRDFQRLLDGDISKLSEDEIGSSGYVAHTFEASIYCLLTTGLFREAVLMAVNLGEDSDTTGAVTGGLAGLLYGVGGIPEDWIDQIARRDDIEDLAMRMAARVGGSICRDSDLNCINH